MTESIGIKRARPQTWERTYGVPISGAVQDAVFSYKFTCCAPGNRKKNSNEFLKLMAMHDPECGVVFFESRGTVCKSATLFLFPDSNWFDHEVEGVEKGCFISRNKYFLFAQVHDFCPKANTWDSIQRLCGLDRGFASFVKLGRPILWMHEGFRRKLRLEEKFGIEIWEIMASGGIPTDPECFVRPFKEVKGEDLTSLLLNLPNDSNFARTAETENGKSEKSALVPSQSLFLVQSDSSSQKDYSISQNDGYATPKITDSSISVPSPDVEDFTQKFALFGDQINERIDFLGDDSSTSIFSGAKETQQALLLNDKGFDAPQEEMIWHQTAETSQGEYPWPGLDCRELPGWVESPGVRYTEQASPDLNDFPPCPYLNENLPYSSGV